jgi:hypothetical protein
MPANNLQAVLFDIMIAARIPQAAENKFSIIS